MFSEYSQNYSGIYIDKDKRVILKNINIFTFSDFLLFSYLSENETFVSNKKHFYKKRIPYVFLVYLYQFFIFRLP